MKRLMSVTIFVACLLAVSPIIRAQDCNFTTWDLRGTYTMQGSGWIDLSKVLAGVPGLPPLPTGFVPMSWVGTHTYDGVGGGGGSLIVNAGGIQLSASFVGLKYSIGPNCSVQASFSMKMNELPQTLPPLGPVTRLLVPVWKQYGLWGMPPALELHMIWQGAVPGASPSPVVDSGVSYRISTQ